MQPVTRAAIEDFYRAYNTRNPELIAPFLDENIDWMLSGPVDIMPHCGQRRGRADVLGIFDGRSIPLFASMAVVPLTILTDGDRAAILGTLSAVMANTKQRIGYRIAHFMRFRDGRIVEFCGIIDSFDAAEQILGRPLELSKYGAQSSDYDLFVVV
jgi:ketosteroid isomerase-like protein